LASPEPGRLKSAGQSSSIYQSCKSGFGCLSHTDPRYYFDEPATSRRPDFLSKRISNPVERFDDLLGATTLTIWWILLYGWTNDSETDKDRLRVESAILLQSVRRNWQPTI